MQVPSPLEVEVHEKTGEPTRIPLVYVIDGLLDIALSVHSLPTFDIRRAACECLKAYFFNHAGVRSHFLRRAIEGHKPGADETANVLTTLLRPDPASMISDPYRHWFASCLVLHLIYEDPASKELAMGVTEGDAETGEEVVTSIQTITAHLISGLNRGNDSRILVGYLMLLICWLFEDLDGVNDFLTEGSNMQGLITAMLQHEATTGPIVQGLCAMLLSVVYEFSTKDSPIPRRTVQSVILSRLSRERYMDKLNSLRCHPLMRDYEVSPQKLDPRADGKLPDVMFDSAFVDFFKDNYSRLLRAIDRDPGLEIGVVTNGIQKGVSRELVDSLRAQNDEKERVLQEAHLKLENLNQQLGQEQADHRRSKEASGIELARMKQVNEALQHNYEAELAKLKAVQERREHEAKNALEGQATHLRAELCRREDELRRQLDTSRRAAEAELERQRGRTEATIADLKATVSRLEVDILKSAKARTHDLERLRAEKDGELGDVKEKLDRAEELARLLQKKFRDAEDQVEGLERDVEAKERNVEVLEREAEEMKGKIAALQKEVQALERIAKINKASSEQGNKDEGGRGVGAGRKGMTYEESEKARFCPVFFFFFFLLFKFSYQSTSCLMRY